MSDETMIDEFDLTKRMGFSGQLLKDCGPGNPPDYQRWLEEKRRTRVAPGEFRFYVNHADSPDATADAIKARIGDIRRSSFACTIGTEKPRSNPR
jgi:hypothetical protein